MVAPKERREERKLKVVERFVRMEETVLYWIRMTTNISEALFAVFLG